MPQACLAAMDPTQASTALSLMAAAVAAHVKQVGALALQVVVLVKIRMQHQVHLHKDLPERLGQAQQVQLAQVVAVEQVQLEFVDSFIPNFLVLNELQVATAAMGFLIQFPELRRITAVAAVVVLITTPAQLSNLVVAEMAAAATVPTTIV